MKDRPALETIAGTLGGILRGLGAGDLRQWSDICDRWQDVVQEPWRSQAKPISLRSGALVVEAVSPVSVSLLKYGVAGLIETLRTEFGEATVSSVTVRPPSR